MAGARASRLLVRLLSAYLLPTLALFALFGWLAYRQTERNYEAALGRRLISIAQALSTQINPEAVAFLAPGDDDSRTAQRLRRDLERIRKRTGVARVTILDRELRSRADTVKSVRIGDRHYQAEADRAELTRAFSGTPASSVLFEGNDGRIYKTGYAPLREGKRVIAAVAVQGSAEFFTALEELRNSLLLIGLATASLVVVISVLFARRITRPLRQLVRAAARIGSGQLDQPIDVRSRDEIGLLAATMNRMRQDLRQRDEQMQLMLSGIAHEVRNPLGGIALFAGMLREELDDDPEQREMVERIERELDLLGRVVNDFLAYARRMPPQLETLALDQLIEEVVQVVRADAEAGSVALDSRTEPTSVLGDAEQLRRVLLNLLRNGVQACSAGGRVEVSCSPDGGPHAEIVDDGCGIPDELREEVFRPFFTTREKGTGLGLALSRKIVDEHGGELSIDSEPGRGTTVRLQLQPARPG